MRSRSFHIVLLMICQLVLFVSVFSLPIKAQTDWRNIKNGWVIPSNNYADQPYVVKTNDGAWLCILTTGVGNEGESGQVVAVTRSYDRGKSWSELQPLEPQDGPEASYAVLLKTASGRIYAFYNHNTDNLRWVKADDPPFKDGKCFRVDSQGYYVFKYSDDHGRTWSNERYRVPVREFEIDRYNPYQADIRFFWNVGKAFIHRGSGYVPLHKVGGFGQGFFTSNEGVLLASSNIMFEQDPEKIQWETLPEGEIGLRTPPGGGPISAEQSFVVLSDDSFYCVYRSVDGHPVYSYSRDGGYNWDKPRYKAYAEGSLMKHPRAANFVWKCENGKYLYWYHNHGGRNYDDRNPAWLCGGVEEDGPDGKIIKWSQPEIVLYDDDQFVRISYPDLVEENARYYLTETQKNVARVHEIDTQLLQGLWGQFDDQPVIAPDYALQRYLDSSDSNQTVDMPELSVLNAGFTLDLKITVTNFEAGDTLLDSRLPNGQGLALRLTAEKTVELILNDGRTESRWDSDPVIESGRSHHVTVIVDGGPKIISFVIDGKFCDGGERRQFGWGRFNPNLRTPAGSGRLIINHTPEIMINLLRIYQRPLRISEAVTNFRAIP